MFNRLLEADWQQREAAARRRVLPAVQRQR